MGRVRPRGVWRSARRCWEFPLEAALSLDALLEGRFSTDPELDRWLSWLRQPLPPLPPHRQLVRAAATAAPLPDGRHLLRHQQLAVRWLLARRGALLADAMGLGKTLTALAAARALARESGCRVLVVAPAGLHGHWQREAASMEMGISLASWARLPSDLPPAGTVLIADEAHYAQNLSAARTRAFLRLARHPRLRAIWLLSGTPMKNGRPVQLLPLLAAIGHPLARDPRAFEERFCQGHWRERGGRLRWEAGGAARLPELRRLIRPLVLHRRKQDCLELPGKERSLHPISLSPAEAMGHEHQIDRAVASYRRRVATGAVRPDAEVLALLTALRTIGARFKLAYAERLLADLTGGSGPVLLFSAFVEPLLRLQDRCGGALLTGRQKPEERQRQVEAFQEGRCPLLLATYGAAGLGYTLHRARHVVLLERPWTPGDAEQAEDRCHRIGMSGPLRCHWLQLGEVDRFVDELIAVKADRIGEVFSDEGRRRRQRELRRRLETWLERSAQ
ncbi:DEAD/DEAH box helicase [Synechococcus sp. RSCCF101]|nr:DEAD/DEAH box helicase [Synechococcus sp. RSCCF101]